MTENEIIIKVLELKPKVSKPITLNLMLDDLAVEILYDRFIENDLILPCISFKEFSHHFYTEENAERLKIPKHFIPWKGKQIILLYLMHKLHEKNLLLLCNNVTQLISEHFANAKKGCLFKNRTLSASYGKYSNEYDSNYKIPLVEKIIDELVYECHKE